MKPGRSLKIDIMFGLTTSVDSSRKDDISVEFYNRLYLKLKLEEIAQLSYNVYLGILK